MNVSPPPPLRFSINRLATRVIDASSGLVAGAQLLEDTRLEGDNWRAAYDGAIKAAGAAWTPPWAGLQQAQKGADNLRDDEASSAAREAVDGAVALTKKAFDQLGRGFMGLPPDLTRDEARQVLDLSARLIRRTAAGVDDAGAALREIARPPTS